jgi:predicted AlkP superfamily phosphohydrolase/phosphomutase
MPRPPRVLFIGLDGGTFTILDALMAQGLMPHLQQVTRAGARADLRSVFPPITAPAWTSFRTGVNPGKHSIYAFTRPAFDADRDGVQLALADAGQIKARCVWSYLDALGARTGVFNLPFTYPVEPLNGVMIAGSMTGGERVASYPDGLVEQVVRATDTHYFDSPVEDGVSQTPAYVSKLTRSVEEQSKVDLWLLNTQEFDLYITVYTQTDPLQHMFYKFLDPRHPAFESEEGRRLRPLLLSFYRTVDGAIGRLLDRCGSDSTVIFVSDHGFQAGDKLFNVNAFLAQHGFVSLRESAVSRVTRYFNWREVLALAARADVLNLKARLGYDLRRKALTGVASVAEPTISLRHSRAFMPSNNEMGIYLNQALPGAERQALHKHLAALLADARDPQTGVPFCRGVFAREDVYDGPFSELGPDLMLLPNAPYQLRASLATRQVTVAQNPLGQIGDHAFEGIFIAHGPPVQPGATLPAASILDITPTLLHLLGAPVPQALDGQVLEAACRAEYRAQHPVARAEVDIYRTPDGASADIYSKDEEANVMKRLRSLGYID